MHFILEHGRRDIQQLVNFIYPMTSNFHMYSLKEKIRKMYKMSKKKSN